MSTVNVVSGRVGSLEVSIDGEVVHSKLNGDGFLLEHQAYDFLLDIRDIVEED